MQENLAKLVIPSQLGTIVGICSLPHPQGGQMMTRANFINGQCRIVPSMQSPAEGPLTATVTINYELPDFSYQVAGTVQAIGGRAAFLGQLFVPRNPAGLTPCQARAKMQDGKKIEVGQFETVQWGVLDPIILTNSPTFVFVTSLIRQALSRLYQRMSQYPYGDDVIAMMDEFFVATAVPEFLAAKTMCCDKPVSEETASLDTSACSKGQS